MFEMKENVFMRMHRGVFYLLELFVFMAH